MYSLAIILAATLMSVDSKQLLVSYPLREPCSPPVPACAPPVPVCAPPVPVCTPSVPVCAPPVPVCSPPVAVCEVTRACAALPFVTDLRTCPDVYFTDLLLSPIGSLDPIFPMYGCPEPAPCAEPPSPFKALACSCGPPPGFTEDYACDCFLRRGCIPPPFI